VIWILVIGGLIAGQWPAIRRPINDEFAGYRHAARYVAAHVPPGTKVADVTGWTLYYAGRPGYTFADLILAPGDPDLRWVVAREAHLLGPWSYCGKLRELTGDLKPVATFPGQPGPGQAKVYVFKRPKGHRSTAMIRPDILHR